MSQPSSTRNQEQLFTIPKSNPRSEPEMASKEQEIVAAVNVISRFLANETLTTSGLGLTLAQLDPTTIILCGSAILHTAHEVFSYVQQCQNQSQFKDHRIPRLRTVVIAGGIGHSTGHLYEAVRRHPLYGSSFGSNLENSTGKSIFSGTPEAVLLDQIRQRVYSDGEPMRSDRALLGEEPTSRDQRDRTGHEKLDNVRIIIEDQSTNCGANAECARKVLENAGIHLGRQRTVDASSQHELEPSQISTNRDVGDELVAVVQDPTMSLRTLKCFEQTYADVLGARDSNHSLKFETVPTFTPIVKYVPNPESSNGAGSLAFDTTSCTFVDVDRLWTIPRFLGLILGEILRLRDDENGYGPKGKGFIGHVHIPDEVEHGWKVLNEAVENGIVTVAR